MREKNCKALLLGGTADAVGKSFIAAGLGRIFARRGLLVAPFKGEERSGDTQHIAGGGEIGYATALQAAACGLEPHVDMNPLLLKPSSADSLQLWLQGRLRGRLTAEQYRHCKAELLPLIRESCRRLQAQVDLLLIEANGNLAESGLLAAAANSSLPETISATTLLVADAERGGAVASLLGTLELLSPAQRSQLRGAIINKAPRDRGLLEVAIALFEQRTGVPVLGVVPRLDLQLEQDAVADSDERAAEFGVRIGVLGLPAADCAELVAVLERETDLTLEIVAAPDQLERLSLLLLPDSESVRDDLEFLQQNGLAAAIRAYHAAGGRVVGFGGGFHLLAERIDDRQGQLAGLGLLDLDIRLSSERQTRHLCAQFQQAAYAAGFGGLTEVEACLVEVAACGYGVLSRSLLRVPGCPEPGGWCEEGAISADGRSWGTGLRDLLSDDRVRYALLAPLRSGRRTAPAFGSARQRRDSELDRLATELEKYLDLEKICACLEIS